MRKTRSSVAWLALSLFVACAAPQPLANDTAAAAEDRAAIDRGHEAFLAAMRANDVDALTPLIADEAVFIPPNVTVPPGRDAFLTWYRQLLTQVKTSAVSVSNREVTVAGDWGIEHANFDWTVTPAAGGAPIQDQGSFIAIWRRQPDGSWKLTRDLWNSSRPLPSSGSGK